MRPSPPAAATILVVDDNPQNRMVAEGHLIGLGYRVVLAEDGPKALEAFELERPALVLLDILMPGMDGYEVCVRMRALPGGRETPIVFLTALAELEAHRRALTAGADDFLTKPIHRTELLMRVSSLLRLKRLYEEKRELTSYIVHDLKNPLVGVLANARYLAKGGVPEGEMRDAAQEIAEAAENLNRMVMNLLDVAQSEEGQLTLRRGPTRLDELLEDVLSLHLRAAKEVGRTVEIDVEPGLESIFADRDVIRRVLENLLDNCLRHTPSGTKVVITARQSGNDVVLKVSDQGEGIPAGLRDRVFEKYAQLDPGSSAGRRGRGLGLAFCRAAVEAHEGRIWVEGNEPKGAIFCFALPRAS